MGQYHHWIKKTLKKDRKTLKKKKTKKTKTQQSTNYNFSKNKKQILKGQTKGITGTYTHNLTRYFSTRTLTCRKGPLGISGVCVQEGSPKALSHCSKPCILIHFLT